MSPTGETLGAELFKRVDEMVYPTVDNAPRYRVILRYMYEQSQIPRDWIGPEEILEHVRRTLGTASYSEANCASDLAFLIEHRNLMAEQERGRARTVEEFQRKRLVYQATPFTIAIERMLIERERATGDRGSLDTTLLERLWAKLNALRIAMDERPAGEPPREFVMSRVHSAWDDAFGDFRDLRQNANAFHLALKTLRPEDLADTEAFLVYKDVLTENLRGFINHLMTYAAQIRDLLAAWRAARMVDLLIEDLVLARVRYLADASGVPPDPEVWREHYRQEWRALDEWFRRGGGVDILRRVTGDNIELVLQHIARLVSRHRSRVSRQRELERLAKAFAACPTLEDAHRLASLALGCATPRHLLGSRAAGTMENGQSVWDQSPHPVALRRIRRGRRARGNTAPIEDVSAEQERVLMEEMNRRARIAEQWNTLFAGGEVDLGGLEVEDWAVAADVLGLVSRCMASTDRTGTAPDGRRVRLVEPDPDEPPGEFVTPDGVLLTPRFRLVRADAAGAR